MDEKIVNYYLSESNSYICSGIKQYKRKLDSDSKEKVLVQKRMLLYTLHDLYSNFILDYAEEENLPKFSYFASLKPEECVYAGDPGTHEICVCLEHENVRLKLNALTNKIKYKDLFEGAVCSSFNVKCMLHECTNCQGKEGIKATFAKYNINITKDSVTFKQWKSEASRALICSCTQNLQDFMTSLIDDVWNLTKHHFIANTQKNFLTYCKNQLQNDTCIILMDFAENYSFVIQRSVQAYYYNNVQATIHPFVVYYIEPEDNGNNKLQQISFCVISDTKDHQAYTVNIFQEKLLEIIKGKFPWISSVIYFSDGAPTQYKNK